MFEYFNSYDISMLDKNDAMNITYLSKQLRNYLSVDKISKLKTEIRNRRNFHDKWFENKYLSQCLFNILKKYDETKHST